jgi:hypothetical protein
MLFLVGQHGGGAFGHQLSFQFGAPGHQGEEHAAHSGRRVHAGAHVHQVQDDREAE